MIRIGKYLVALVGSESKIHAEWHYKKQAVLVKVNKVNLAVVAISALLIGIKIKMHLAPHLLLIALPPALIVLFWTGNAKGFFR